MPGNELCVSLLTLPRSAVLVTALPDLATLYILHPPTPLDLDDPMKISSTFMGHQLVKVAPQGYERRLGASNPQ